MIIIKYKLSISSGYSVDLPSAGSSSLNKTQIKFKRGNYTIFYLLPHTRHAGATDLLPPRTFRACLLLAGVSLWEIARRQTHLAVRKASARADSEGEDPGLADLGLRDKQPQVSHPLSQQRPGLSAGHPFLAPDSVMGGSGIPAHTPLPAKVQGGCSEWTPTATLGHTVAQRSLK